MEITMETGFKIKQENFEIKSKVISCEIIAASTYRMVLEADASRITAPGQFINISIPGFFLRRPISINDWSQEKNTITIIFKVVGKGTEVMSHMTPGTQLDILTGLGNGFDTQACGKKALLVGGGCGVAPVYGLARRLVLMGKSVDVIAGFNTSSEVFGEAEFDVLNELYDFGCEGFEGEKPQVRVFVTTVDGTCGTKGFVTDCLDKVDKEAYYYACGPLPMLKALKSARGSYGELSLEERMGCGFGACVGCSVETTEGFKKVCKDGPVFKADTVLR